MKATYSTVLLTSWESQYLYLSEGKQNFWYLQKRKKRCQSGKKKKKEEQPSLPLSDWQFRFFASTRECRLTGIAAIPFSTDHHWQKQNLKDLILQPCYSNTTNLGGLLGKKTSTLLRPSRQRRALTHWCPKIPPLRFGLEIPTKHLLQQTRTRRSSVWLPGTSNKMPLKLPFSSLKGLTCCVPKLKLTFLIFAFFFSPKEMGDEGLASAAATAELI